MRVFPPACKYVYVCAKVHVRKSEDNFQELVISCHSEFWGSNLSCQVCIARASILWDIPSALTFTFLIKCKSKETKYFVIKALGPPVCRGEMSEAERAWGGSIPSYRAEAPRAGHSRDSGYSLDGMTAWHDCGHHFSSAETRRQSLPLSLLAHLCPVSRSLYLYVKVLYILEKVEKGVSKLSSVCYISSQEKCTLFIWRSFSVENRAGISEK